MSTSDFSSLIPLRGGSKGIPKKNIIMLKNKPLFWYVTNASVQSGIETYISTEDEAIKALALNYFDDINILDRPKEIALDTSTTEEVIEHFIKNNVTAKHIVLLQATSPLTTRKDIEEAIKTYLNNACKPLLSVVHEYSFLWNKQGQALNYNPIKRPRRQDWEGNYKENGAIYIFSRKHFEEYKCRLSDNCSLYLMRSKTSVEIDNEEDLEIVTSLMNAM
tara:strand:- start:689 stop:1348 length:660 start_codon:yes stop_codon:yes gene_type:complete